MGAAVAKRIVVGYDGSEVAQRALDRAAELAGYGTSVTVVSVAPALYGPGLPPLADPADTAWAHALLDDARARLTARHVSVTTVEPVGDAAEQIVDTAEAVGADLVIIGTRNGHTLEHLVLGSTSVGVLHHARCDVLVVR